MVAGECPRGQNRESEARGRHDDDHELAHAAEPDERPVPSARSLVGARSMNRSHVDMVGTGALMEVSGT
jgi:hypothetical protein